MQANVQFRRIKQTLRRRIVALIVANRALKKEIRQRRVIEVAFRENRRESRKLLAQTQRMQEQLRQLSDRLLKAHEEERKEISRELHDEIAQASTGNEVHQSHLKSEAISSSPHARLLQRQKSGLSSREVEVIQLIAEGMTNKEVASELGIGVKTVEKHREHLMRKLDIHNTAGLTRYAINTGVIGSNLHLTIG
jgi:DNA-binding NarL/FixJ family response regulator